jgi:hypothetical protein
VSSQSSCFEKASERVAAERVAVGLMLGPDGLAGTVGGAEIRSLGFEDGEDKGKLLGATLGALLGGREGPKLG